MTRLGVIKSSKFMVTCQCCNFTYLPMTKRTETNCPKCEPIEQEQTVFVDPDITYLNNKVVLEENVNTDYLNEGWGIDYTQLAL